MDELQITVSGRHYMVACGKEEAPRVRALAAELDREVGKIEREAGSARAILMAALTMIDQERSRSEHAARRVEAVAEEIERLSGMLPDGEPASGGRIAASPGDE